MGLAHHPTLLVVGIAWRQRHQDGVAASCTYIINILSHVSAVGIDRLLLAGLLDGDMQRVVAHAGDAGTGTSLVVRAVVVMADADDDPVARTDGITDGRPQLVIKGAAAHAAQRLVLHRNPGGVEILVGVVAPAPLAVVAVAHGTSTHRGIANQEEHGIVPLSARTRYRTGRHGLGDTVRGVVDDAVDILHATTVVHLCRCRQHGQGHQTRENTFYQDGGYHPIQNLFHWKQC